MKSSDNGHILVCGGAGYIGCHVVHLLKERGYHPVILDNLSTGHARNTSGFDFEEADLQDVEGCRRVFKTYRPEAVVHLAANALVGESMSNPRKYFENNVMATLNLLHLMQDFQCNRFVFSSSCAVYGVPQDEFLSEGHPREPVNPYGETKLMVEKFLVWYGKLKNLNFFSFRYFNAAGALPGKGLGEDHDPETHLIPNILSSILQKKGMKVFGDDYKTPDGTCVRDYIHVMDIADAHVMALDHMRKNETSGYFLNLAIEQGYSVKEIIELSEKITGKKVDYRVEGRRPGDPDSLKASAKPVKSILGWSPKHDVQKMILDAWEWEQQKTT